MGPGDQHAVGLRLGEPEQSGGRAGDEAVDDDRADDHQEHDRHDLVGVGDVLLLESDREDRRHGGSDDAARRHRREEHAFPPA